jgi:hypothetical protein
VAAVALCSDRFEDESAQVGVRREVPQPLSQRERSRLVDSSLVLDETARVELVGAMVLRLGLDRGRTLGRRAGPLGERTRWRHLLVAGSR